MCEPIENVSMPLEYHGLMQTNVTETAYAMYIPLDRYLLMLVFLIWACFGFESIYRIPERVWYLYVILSLAAFYYGYWNLTSTTVTILVSVPTLIL